MRNVSNVRRSPLSKIAILIYLSYGLRKVMHTERFRQLRKDALSNLLDKKHVSLVWRKIVRGQLRSFDIKDLYDHYDFNYNIELRAVALKSQLLEGSYKVSPPLIYRLEKKYGVCRHMVVPQPADALLLQILVESFAEQVLKKQPSKNAFYSRDRHNVKKPHEEIEYGVPFRLQWKKLQKKIYNFNEKKKLLTVTDLSNYYDSISLDELRKVLLSQVDANEVLVDLLFKVIEGVSWVPDYLPYSRRGLPTANIEAIRLLAHSFLFEIDEVIKNKTSDSFARWMDDITIGNDSRQEAIALLSSVSDMLKSRGLALNLSKTVILDSKNAEHHFQIDQNKYLDTLEGVESSPKKIQRKAEIKLYKEFQKHLSAETSAYWEKITKRYITAFGRLGSTKLLDHIADMYVDNPSLRPNFLIYLTKLDYSEKNSEVIAGVLSTISVFDDLSLFQISYLLTSWDIPRSKNGTKFVSQCDNAIARLGFEHNEPLGFYAIVWFRSKYYSPSKLLNFLIKYRNYWQSHSFLRRQVTATLARLLPMNNNKPKEILEQQSLSGVPSTVSVANQISTFSEYDTVETKVRMYLFPDKAPRVYPHSKFLVLCSLLNSEKLRTNPEIKKLVQEFICDSYYRHWLHKQYGIAK